jgi:hypothetical protein
MPDTTEQKIIDRALVVLAAIDGTGSYQTNIAGRVADSRPNWHAEVRDENGNVEITGELPAISVFQGVVEVEDRDDEGLKVLRRMPLMFKGFLERGTDAETARRFLSDICRAIRTAAGDQWEVGGVKLAQRTEEGQHAIEYAEDTFEITGVEQQVSIYYIGTNMDLEA